MSNLRPVTLITGASAGIGVALAREFARPGYALALVARRADRLNWLADEIAASGVTRPIVIATDLALAGATQTITDLLNAAGAEPQFVVNNAGFGLVGVAASLFPRHHFTAPAFITTLIRNNPIIFVVVFFFSFFFFSYLKSLFTEGAILID